jgi:hypothetical protein
MGAIYIHIRATAEHENIENTPLPTLLAAYLLTNQLAHRVVV